MDGYDYDTQPMGTVVAPGGATHQAMKFLVGNDFPLCVELVEDRELLNLLAPFVLPKVGQNTALGRNDYFSIEKKKLQFEVDYLKLMRTIPRKKRTKELQIFLDGVRQVYFEGLDRSLNAQERKAFHTTITEQRSESTQQREEIRPKRGFLDLIMGALR